MLNRMFLTIGFAVLALQAGPPLICHPHEIGTAASLPWGSNAASGWDNPDPNYNTQQLSADTLRLLNAETPVLVRMETLRRAAIYGEKNHAAAADLLSKLRQRTTESQNAALALFDYGYFVESIKEMQWKYKDDLTGGVDGGNYVNKALALLPESKDVRWAADTIRASKHQ